MKEVLVRAIRYTDPQVLKPGIGPVLVPMNNGWIFDGVSTDERVYSDGKNYTDVKRYKQAMVQGTSGYLNRLIGDTKTDITVESTLTPACKKLYFNWQFRGSADVVSYINGVLTLSVQYTFGKRQFEVRDTVKRESFFDWWQKKIDRSGGWYSYRLSFDRQFLLDSGLYTDRTLPLYTQQKGTDVMVYPSSLLSKIRSLCCAGSPGKFIAAEFLEQSKDLILTVQPNWRVFMSGFAPVQYRVIPVSMVKQKRLESDPAVFDTLKALIPDTEFKADLSRWEKGTDDKFWMIAYIDVRDRTEEEIDKALEKLNKEKEVADGKAANEEAD